MRFQTLFYSALLFVLAISGLAYGSSINTDESCDTLRASVRSGAEPRSALRDVFRTNPEFCPIVRCALEIGIPLKAVNMAARDASLQDHMVTKCATATCSQTFRLFETDEVCRQIKSEVEKGRDAAQLTLEKIRQGYQACTVLKCAVAAGADLDGVIKAARDANLSDDIISRCCVDGCADPYRVSRLIKETDPFVPIGTTKPGGSRPGYLSPSGF